ncbi:MAG TPA: transposase [Bacteroidales bacterium]|nr:transposase [Bacteroidales bacterium]
MKQELFEPGNYYHIFNRGNNKENLFKEKENYIYFLQLMEKYLPEICNIYSYCLLPNHFHILLKIKEVSELPVSYQKAEKRIHQPFSNMFNAYTKAINKRYNRTGSLFQEHLHRIKVDTEEYFKNLVLYIHLNPEKHKIIDCFSSYDYSSYKAYLNKNESLLNKSEVVDYFDDISNFIICHQDRKIRLELINEVEKLDY